MGLLATAQRLRERGVLGINRRNGDYVLRYNPRRLYPLVDDKLETKRLAVEHGLPTPPLYGVIRTEHDLRTLPEILREHPDFALKPAHGAGGDGILVVTGQRGGRFRKSNGLWITADDIEYHVSNILSGVYSLGGQGDAAMIEYRVRFSPLFEKISFQGVPDVRIIVLRGYPIMAMARLPTRQSEGRANLHQGAIGAGIDLASGRTLDGVWLNGRVAEHPDTDEPLAGLEIPGWEDFLLLAARCYEITGLGYLGVDIVVDRDLGPLLLELNARPGLNIQIANDAGLLTRCRIVEAEPPRPPAERVALSRRVFGNVEESPSRS